MSVNTSLEYLQKAQFSISQVFSNCVCYVQKVCLGSWRVLPKRFWFSSDEKLLVKILSSTNSLYLFAFPSFTFFSSLLYSISLFSLSL